jgi:hypothetical protein
MATIKAKVIGPNPVCGVLNGNYVDLDTNAYNVSALVDAGHIELSKTQEKILVEAPEVVAVPNEPSA